MLKIRTARGFMLSWLTAFFAFTISTIAAAQSVQNVNVSGTVDAIAPFSLDSTADNKLAIRSAEVLLYGPIDHVFDGMLNLAAHDEGGEYQAELHEAFFGCLQTDSALALSRGQVFLNVGRLNGFHQHDWPFATAPRMQRDFFSPAEDTVHAEGASDTGVRVLLADSLRGFSGSHRRRDQRLLLGSLRQNRSTPAGTDLLPASHHVRGHRPGTRNVDRRDLSESQGL